jgi:hypothetical protein
MADELTEAEYAEMLENRKKLQDAFKTKPKETTEAFYEAFGRYAPKKGDLSK